MHCQEVAQESARLVQLGLLGLRSVLLRRRRPQRPARPRHGAGEWLHNAFLGGGGEFPARCEPNRRLADLLAALAARLRNRRSPRLRRVDCRQILVVADGPLEARGQAAPEVQIVADPNTLRHIVARRHVRALIERAQHGERVGHLHYVHPPRLPARYGGDLLIQLRLQLQRRRGLHAVAGQCRPSRIALGRHTGGFEQVRPRLRERVRELLPAQLKRMVAGAPAARPVRGFSPHQEPATGLAGHPSAVQDTRRPCLLGPIRGREMRCSLHPPYPR